MKCEKTFCLSLPTYHPALANLKNISMSKWHLIQNQPLLREIYDKPPKEGVCIYPIMLCVELYCQNGLVT